MSYEIVVQVKLLQVLTVVQVLNVFDLIEGKDQSLQVYQILKTCDLLYFVVEHVYVSYILHVVLTADVLDDALRHVFKLAS